MLEWSGGGGPCPATVASHAPDVGDAEASMLARRRGAVVNDGFATRARVAAGVGAVTEEARHQVRAIAAQTRGHAIRRAVVLVDLTERAYVVPSLPLASGSDLCIPLRIDR